MKNGWPETQEELDELNRQFARDAFLWRETELPKLRARYIASGFVPRTAIQDNIVSSKELLADPHEVWMKDWYTDGWVRVEITG